MPLLEHAQSCCTPSQLVDSSLRYPFITLIISHQLQFMQPRRRYLCITLYNEPHYFPVSMYVTFRLSGRLAFTVRAARSRKCVLLEVLIPEKYFSGWRLHYVQFPGQCMPVEY